MSRVKLTLSGLVVSSLVVVALLTLPGSALAATTWHVGPTRTYTTIQAAIDAPTTVAGDTIEVDAGTYDLTSRIEVNKAVSIVGDVTTPANVVVNAPTAGGTQHGQNSVFMILSSDVTVRGFRIQGALHTGAAQNAGIYVDDPRFVSNPGLSNITISNNEATNNGFGIVVQNIKNSTISNNKVYSSIKVAGKESESGVGIVAYGRAEDSNHTYDLTIDNNQVYANETEGIRVDVTSDVGSSPWVNDLDITISNNTVYSNGSTVGGADKYLGIKSAGWSKGVTVADNEIYGHAMGAAPTNTNQSSGIWIAASNNWQIIRNNIHDNTNGIFFAFSTFDPGSGSHTITDNNIHANIRGISIDDGSEAVANNNGIYSNDSTAFSGIGFAPYGVINSGSTAFNAMENWWSSATGPTHTSNIGGTGDKVSDHVNYSPWWGANYVGVAHPWNWHMNSTSTIQDAIDAASASDIINVKTGTYNVTSQIEVNKSLSIVGDVATPANVVVDAGGGSFSVFNVTASNVNISGLKATDTLTPGNQGYAGIRFGSGVANCNIHDNILIGDQYGILLIDPENTTTPGNNTFTSNAAMSNSVSGIEMQHSYGNTFTGNTANGNGSYGFRLDGVSHNTFTNNTADSNTVNGFSLVKGSSTGGCLYNTFTGNTANSNTQYGFREDYGDHNTLTGNTFDQNVISAIRFKETITNLTVQNNTITNSPTGVDITFSTVQPDVSTWTVTDNDLSGSTSYGISNGGTGTLNATQNWWGSDNGPKNSARNTFNVATQGSACTNSCNIAPWRKTSMTGALFAPITNNDVPSENYGSFTDAIAGTTAAGTINAVAGTYTEDFTVDKSLTILGAQYNVDATGPSWLGSTVIEAPGGAGATQYDGFSPHIKASNIVFKGFKVKSTAAPTANAGFYVGGEHVTLDSVEIANCEVTGRNEAGIIVSNLSLGSITNVDINHVYAHHNASGNGIKTINITGPSISYNKITSNGTAGAIDENRYGLWLGATNSAVDIHANVQNNAFGGNGSADTGGSVLIKAHSGSGQILTGTAINGNSFAETGGYYGINNMFTTTVDGTDNWWNRSTGPTTMPPPTIVPGNPGGTGAKVSDYVTYAPFRTSIDLTLTASAGANGSITPSGVVHVDYDASQTFTITPAAHYHIATLTVDGTPVTPPVGTYTFNHVMANHTIATSFAIDTNKITSSEGAHGSIAPLGAVTVSYGANKTFTITPAANYKVDKVLVDGTSVGAVTTYTFNNVKAAHTISATFVSKADANCHWYLAEGTTDYGFDTYINIENPNSSAVTALVTFMTKAGPRTRPGLVLPAMSQTVINPRDDIGATDFSTKVECKEGKPICADRRMVWTGAGAPSSEGHSSVGVTSPAKTWYLAEGSSKWGFETWLLIQNPNSKPATCTVTYMTADAGPIPVTKTVPANTRASFNMETDIGQKDASIKVQSTIPVIPERAIYRNNRREGHDSIGTTTPARDYYLAEGTTDWGFTTYVLVQNPNASANTVNITYMTPTGPVPQAAFTVPANSRQTVRVNDVLPGKDLSIHVSGSQPLIAERAMYWGAGTPAGEACHDSIGMASPHTTFYLPDGETTSGCETWTLVQNSNSSSVQVQISYLTPNGQGNVVKTETVGANSRKSFNMAQHSGINGRASVIVTSKTSGKKIMVERAMYWNNRGAGTDTIGGFSD